MTLLTGNEASVLRVLTPEMKKLNQTLCCNPVCRRIIQLTPDDTACGYLCDQCMETPLAEYIGAK